MKVLSPTGYLHRKMVAWRMEFSGPHFPKDLILTAVAGIFDIISVTVRWKSFLRSEESWSTSQRTIDELLKMRPD
ncbi:MAG: hypothetical protein QGI86_23275 [Candidatus Poribacteria bacterium]|jgi:hypothetical protein|nr:hypothetical protein [Candidatus Poribacteria bacterium]MDP7000086.1 hypothetical protein [Candidatus Poribacteria bacterium]